MVKGLQTAPHIQAPRINEFIDGITVLSSPEVVCDPEVRLLKEGNMLNRSKSQVLFSSGVET